jgi:serine/threonine-protein kinase HipA
MNGEMLVVLLGGREIGRIERDRRGRLVFLYDSKWRALDDAMPLSLSMPLAAAEHPHARVDAWLWGLLPDNHLILERWGRRFQISARNAFGLISRVGEDCAGAVQIVRPERLAAVQVPRRPEVAWLAPRQIGERLAQLRLDHSAWRSPEDAGQFSLTGAQPKTALYFDGRRWGVPAGRTPTTHILKPAHGEFAGHIENEHFCLALARELGLPAASSEVRRFGDEPAIVVERYDRVRSTGPGTQRVVRLHQEDICQALGLLPSAKYQSEGGPSARDVARLLRDHSSSPAEDVDAFVDALGFSWLIAGTDAHAKNYSVLHAAGGRVRLAPLYDVATALPYGFDPHRLRLAMKIGGPYRIRSVGARQWRSLASELRLDGDRVVSRLADMAARLPDAAAAIGGRSGRAGLDRRFVERQADLLAARAAECGRALGR